jgi:hypothetical protein
MDPGDDVIAVPVRSQTPHPRRGHWPQATLTSLAQFEMSRTKSSERAKIVPLRAQQQQQQQQQASFIFFLSLFIHLQISRILL